MSYNIARRRNESHPDSARAKQTRLLSMVLGEVGVLIGIGLLIGWAQLLLRPGCVTSFTG